MVRNNRQIIRLSFVLVILAASLGWWLAGIFWQFDSSLLTNPVATDTADGEGDWVDVMASIADRMLLLFLDVAGSGG